MPYTQESLTSTLVAPSEASVHEANCRTYAAESGGLYIPASDRDYTVPAFQVLNRMVEGNDPEFKIYADEVGLTWDDSFRKLAAAGSEYEARKLDAGAEALNDAMRGVLNEIIKRINVSIDPSKALAPVVPVPREAESVVGRIRSNELIKQSKEANPSYNIEAAFDALSDKFKDVSAEAKAKIISMYRELEAQGAARDYTVQNPNEPIVLDIQILKKAASVVLIGGAIASQMAVPHDHAPRTNIEQTKQVVAAEHLVEVAVKAQLPKAFAPTKKVGHAARIKQVTDLNKHIKQSVAHEQPITKDANASADTKAAVTFITHNVQVIQSDLAPKADKQAKALGDQQVETVLLVAQYPESVAHLQAPDIAALKQSLTADQQAVAGRMSANLRQQLEPLTANQQEVIPTLLAVIPDTFKMPDVIVAPAPAPSTPEQKPGTTETQLQLDIESYTGTNWTKEELQTIKELYPIYKKAADKHNIPWQFLAVLHLREHALAVDNPKNHQGPYQFYGERHTDLYPVGPITLEQFSVETDHAAKLIKENYSVRGVSDGVFTADQYDESKVKDIFFSYNGRAKLYRKQAAALGYDPQTQGFEGSPYVENEADDQRDSTKNPNWKQYRSDGGDYLPANHVPGAMLYFKDLVILTGDEAKLVGRTDAQATPKAPEAPVAPAPEAPAPDPNAETEFVAKSKALVEQLIANPNVTIAESPNDRTRLSILDVQDDGKTFLYDVDQDNNNEVTVSQDLLQALNQLAVVAPYKIESLTTSHDHEPTSNHYKGKAVDISGDFPTLYKFLFENREALGINELIFGGQLPDGETTLKHGEAGDYPQEVLDGHTEHIHVSFKN
jgi:hypothetical protein